MKTRTEDELKSAAAKLLAEYEEGIENVIQERDAKIRQLGAQGWKQAEIARATGYSRETIRQAMNPQIRAKIKAKRAGKEG